MVLGPIEEPVYEYCALGVNLEVFSQEPNNLMPKLSDIKYSIPAANLAMIFLTSVRPNSINHC